MNVLRSVCRDFLKAYKFTQSSQKCFGSQSELLPKVYTLQKTFATLKICNAAEISKEKEENKKWKF